MHYTIKEFSWKIQAQISAFLIKERSTVCKRMKAEGYRTSQIARIVFGDATPLSMTKVSQLLKEVK
jgi:hypothetical protein